VQSRENNVTIMLVSVVMVFIVCQVPALIYNMAYAINVKAVLMSEGWMALSTLRNFLVNLNSAINFILYCALGQKFRRTFVRTFCPCLARRGRDGFHSFTHHNNDMHNSNHSHNGAVYMKLLKKSGDSVGKMDSLALTTATTRVALSSSTSALAGCAKKKVPPLQNGQNGGSGKASSVSGSVGLGLAPGSQLSLNSSNCDISKDQDSGVVVHTTKYSSPRASLESGSANCDSAIYLAASGRGKTKTRVSARPLLPKSKDDV
jgi:hypothetical protein